MTTPVGVRLDTSFRIRLDRAVPRRRGPGGAPHRTRRSPGDLVAEPTAGTLPVRSRSARWRPTRRTGCGSRASSTRTASRSRPWTPVEVHDGGRAVGRRRQAARTTTKRVARDAAITVRFTGRDGRGAHRPRPLHVTADGKAVKGDGALVARTARGSTFTPKKRLPYDAKVVARGRPRPRELRRRRPARSTPSEGRLPDRARARPPSVAGIPTGGGGAAVGQLGRGRDVLPAPDELHPDRRLGHVVGGVLVARRPERRAAVAQLGDLDPRVAARTRGSSPTRNACSHFIGGNPGDRLRAAGFGSYNWAENIGCRSRQPVRLGARDAPVLPARAALQRRPLPEPHEPGVQPGRHRRLGVRRARPAGHRLLRGLTASFPRRVGPSGR